jgi:hypothetical protein
MPKRYTEFILPDQETPSDNYIDAGGYADGNEYLIVSSLYAPNSNMDTDRTDECKYYDEHEIITMIGGGNSGSGNAQFAMILDGSGSITSGDWTIMRNGVADAIRNCLPHDGSVELTVIQFSTGPAANARVEIAPIVINAANFESVATTVQGISQLNGRTPVYAGIDLATTTLFASPNFASYPRKVINLVTDGAPNEGSPTPQQAAINSRNNLISTLGMTPDEDEFDIEFVGSADISWFRDNIAWPEPGYDNWPPTGPGWIRQVSSYTEFSATICEKFELIFGGMYVPRFAFEFDAVDGTGLFLNGMDQLPPTADANGPYYGNCEEPVIFDGSGSHDNDESGLTIVQYDWKFFSGDTWHNDIGAYPSYTYNTPGTYMVSLRVTDNEGATDEVSVFVDITCDGDDDDDDDDTDARIVMENAYPCDEDTYFAYLKAENIPVDVCSVEVSLSWDPDVVSIVDVDDGEFETLVPYLDNVAGTLNILAYNTVTPAFTGDFNIARIEFGATGDTDDNCPLVISESLLLTCDPVPDEVIHAAVNGMALICGPNGGTTDCDGDMNGDTSINSADVRYLALHIAGDPAYSILYAEGDVNSDLSINSADVRYLALFLAGDPNYDPLCP